MTTAESRHVRSGVPQFHRVCDALLGGKDNFAADRDLACRLALQWPQIPKALHAGQETLRRAITAAVRDGIRQFLDLGTGLPSTHNALQAAQRLEPTSRTVYVATDPVVLAHARALLHCISPRGVTEHVDADVRDPETVLRAATHTLDFREPVAVLMADVLGQIPDDHQPSPAAIARTVIDAIPAGSHVVIHDIVCAPHTIAAAAVAAEVGVTFYPRTAEEIQGFLRGLDIIDLDANTSGPDALDVCSATGRKP